MTISDRTRQKNKDTKLNNTTNHVNLNGIYKTHQQPIVKYTRFSSTLGIFSKMDHMVAHKTMTSKGLKSYEVCFTPRELN